MSTAAEIRHQIAVQNAEAERIQRKQQEMQRALANAEENERKAAQEKAEEERRRAEKIARKAEKAKRKAEKKRQEEQGEQLVSRSREDQAEDQANANVPDVLMADQDACWNCRSRGIDCVMTG